MDLFDLLGRGATVHRECRDCGQNLAAEEDCCPACGGDVAEYVLEE